MLIKTKQRNISIVMIVTLVLSLLIPSLAFAYEVKGDPDHATLTIHKFEQEPGADPGEEGTGLPGQAAEGTPVKGVKYTLIQTHKFNPATNEWTEVTGHPKTYTGITDVGGKVVFDGLDLGRYQVEETDGPEHIILNPDKFFVDVPMTSKDGTILNYDVHIYPKNETIRGDMELIKRGEDEGILEGVSFGLYHKNGGPVLGADSAPVVLKTDAEGSVKVENLAAGTYYFQETATIDGYAINETKIFFTVTKKDGASVVNWEPIEGFVDAEGVVTNYILPEVVKDANGDEHLVIDRGEEFPYNLTITTPGDIQDYKSFAVTDTLDSRLEYAGEWSVTGTDQDNIEFTEATVGGKEVLTWSIKDFSKVEPNQEIVITFTAKIKLDAELTEGEIGIDNKASWNFDNNKGQTGEKETDPVVVTPTDGGFKVIKVDKKDTNVKLAGAEFKLTTDEAGVNVVDASGTVIKVNGDAYSGLLENLVTDVNGEIVIEGLTPGTYYLHETKAPTYVDANGVENSYRLLTAPVQVKVVDSFDILDVVVKNSKSGWSLPTTGGIGTILFTFVGLTLMGTATYAFFRRRQNASL